MGVRVELREYKNAFRIEEPSILIGNSGDWQEVTFTFRLSVHVEATIGEPIQIMPPNQIKLMNGKTWNEYGFDDGDSVVVLFTRNIGGAIQTFNVPFVIDYVNGDVMYSTTTLAPFPLNIIPGQGNDDNSNFVKIYDVHVYSNKKAQALLINYMNLDNDSVGNPTLSSFIDGTESWLEYQGLDLLPSGAPTWEPMTLEGKRSGMGILYADVTYFSQVGAYEHKYQVRIMTFNTSLFNDISNLQNLVAPDQLFDVNSMTDNLKVLAQLTYNDPNVRIENNPLDTAVEGNTGWFNENFNGGADPLSVVSVSYTDNTGPANPVNGILYNAQTKVTIEIAGIANLSDTLGSETKVNYGFCWVPKDKAVLENNFNGFHENIYLNTGGTQGTNVFSVGVPPGGIRSGYGIGLASMSVYNISFVKSGANMIFTATFTPTTALRDFFETLDDDDRNYMIWISAGDRLLATNYSDRVNKLCDFNQMEKFIAPLGEFALATEFLEHPRGENEVGVPYYDGFLEDDVLCKSLFKLDPSVDTFTKTKFQIQIEKTATGEFEVLESIEVDWTNVSLDQNNTQLISHDQDRGFKLEVGNNKNWVKIERNPSADVGADYGYKSYYAFKIRWEYWIQKLGLHTDFTDVSLQFNGFSENWLHYLNTLGWEANVVIRNEAISNGQVGEYINKYPLTWNDYEFNDTIDTLHEYYNQSDNSLLNIGIDPISGRPLGMILNNDLTRIEITYTLNNGFNFDIAQVYCTTCIEIDEGAGELSFRQLSSVWGSESDNPLKPLPTETKLKVELIAPNVIKTSCLVDPAILSESPRYKITGRIGSYVDPSLGAKLTEDGQYKLQEDGLLKIIE